MNNIQNKSATKDIILAVILFILSQIIMLFVFYADTIYTAIILLLALGISIYLIDKRYSSIREAGLGDNLVIIVKSLGFFLFLAAFYMCVSTFLGDKIDMQSNQEIIKQLVLSNPLISGIAICLVGPILEELTFRGYLLEAVSKLELKIRYLMGKKQLDFKITGFAMVFCTILFALAHAPTGLGWVLYMIPAIGLMTLRYYTGNVLAGIVCHVIWNTSSFLMLLNTLS